jgi:hypothetical protein
MLVSKATRTEGLGSLCVNCAVRAVAASRHEPMIFELQYTSLCYSHALALYWRAILATRVWALHSNLAEPYCCVTPLGLPALKATQASTLRLVLLSF